MQPRIDRSATLRALKEDASLRRFYQPLIEALLQFAEGDALELKVAIPPPHRDLVLFGRKTLLSFARRIRRLMASAPRAEISRALRGRYRTLMDDELDSLASHLERIAAPEQHQKDLRRMQMAAKMRCDSAPIS